MAITEDVYKRQAVCSLLTRPKICEQYDIKHFAMEKRQLRNKEL